MKKTLSLLLVAILIGASFVSYAEAKKDTPLVISTEALSEKFSPFFGVTGYDIAVADMTQQGILTTDRLGKIINNAIEGETVSYNGKDYTYKGIADTSVKYDEKEDKTVYTAKLKEGLKFSDGEEITADDIIFTYYVKLDPSFDGPSTLRSYDIVGLNAYLTQTPTELYDKYNKVVAAIVAKAEGKESEEKVEFTQEQYDAVMKAYADAWTKGVEDIVDLVNTQYEKEAKEALGVEKIEENQRVAAAVAAYGFGSVEDGKLVLVASEKSFDMKNNEFPTVDDLVLDAKTKYNNNIDKFFEKELDAKGSKSDEINKSFIKEWGASDPDRKDTKVANIEGIKKIDKYTVEVTLNGFSAPAVYQILGQQVTPMHYYGDPAQYDYDNNKFGFPYGDLSIVKSKTSKPMGAGRYKFVEYKNRIAYFEANEYYFDGEPKVKYLQFKESKASENVPAVVNGTIDIADLAGGKKLLEQVMAENSNKELVGDKLTATLVDNLGYGYIGINANTVNVGGGEENAATDASKALRKALATTIAYYRDIAVDSYYGDAASVIQYPISNTSWAAPQKSDSDYRRAFSMDAEGNDIYTEGMSFEEGEEAALKATRSWLVKAGYELDENGKAVKAPEGAKLSYEIIIPASGTGDHPSYSILTRAKELLAKAGIELKINDPADANILWNTLDSGNAELWCAAWGATIDPDMYQVYHSSNRVGLPGSTASNKYSLNDPDLDKYIIDARKSDDQSYRKAVYKSALDVIMDWAVEIPVYQRKNGNLFSSERINIDTILPDPTTYYNYGESLHLLELK